LATFPLDSATAGTASDHCIEPGEFPKCAYCNRPTLTSIHIAVGMLRLSKNWVAQQSFPRPMSALQQAAAPGSVRFLAEPSFAEASLVGNTATSDYNALQVHSSAVFPRGLQGSRFLYVSHSIDDGSEGVESSDSEMIRSSTGCKKSKPGTIRFCIRHAFSAA